MTQEIWRQHPEGSAERVVAHALWQRRRGRKPSEPYQGITNPIKALELAQRHATYACTSCGAMRVKLWRKRNTKEPALHCVTCACKLAKLSVKRMNADGTRTQRIDGRTELTDKIGSFVPAIPKDGFAGYHTYGATPKFAKEWWAKLPTFHVPSALN